MNLFFTQIILLLSFSAVHAQEGVSTQIDASRLNQVMEWVENSKYTLDTELDSIQRTAIPDQERHYESLLDRLLKMSGDKPNEFLMRNVLYRTNVIYTSLKEVPESPKRYALARRVLEDGFRWAQKLYQADKNLLQLARQGKLTEELRGVEFAGLGVEWADYMLSLYYVAPTNQMKLQLMKDMMGIMYNDINNDDAVNRILAPISGAIVTENSRLSSLQGSNPIENLLAARNLRRFMEVQLDVAKKTLTTYRTANTRSSISQSSQLTAEEKKN